MGSNVSTQDIEQTQNIIKSTLNTQNTNTDSTLKCDANATQNIVVTAENIIMKPGCKINIGQKSTVSLSCTMKASQQVKTQQGAQATAQLKAMGIQKITEANKKLNLGQSNVSVVHSKSNQYLDDHVQNIINSTIKSTINSSASGDQTLKINLNDLDCEGGELDISQDGVLNSISKSVSKQLVAGWQKAVGADVVSALSTQKGKLTNSGIDLNMIFVIIGIVIICGLGLFVYFITTSEKTAVSGATGLANAASNVTTLSAPNYNAAIPQPAMPKPQHLGNID